MPREFKVRDFRNKQFHIVDDEYLNGYAKFLDPFATVIYYSLCRHADKDQSCFPSQELIAKEHNIGVRTVIEKLKLLQEWKIIKKVRERTTTGKWLRNTYYLLDKSEWKKKPSAGAAHGQPSADDCISQVQELHTKDTHYKDTHILSIAKPHSLNTITEENLVKVAQDYQVPLAFVRSKYDDLVNYCQRTGKRYQNYLAALRNFVKQDAMKIRQGVSELDRKRGIDATHLRR